MGDANVIISPPGMLFHFHSQRDHNIIIATGALDQVVTDIIEGSSVNAYMPFSYQFYEDEFLEMVDVLTNWEGDQAENIASMGRREAVIKCLMTYLLRRERTLGDERES